MAIPIQDEHPACSRNKGPPPDLIPQFELEQNRENEAHKSNRDFLPLGRHGWTRRSREAESAARLETHTDKRRQRWAKFKRGVCCFGWIVCCPIFCAVYLLREPPVDEDDYRDDDCIPCYK